MRKKRGWETGGDEDSLSQDFLSQERSYDSMIDADAGAPLPALLYLASQIVLLIYFYF